MASLFLGFVPSFTASLSAAASPPSPSGLMLDPVRVVCLFMLQRCLELFFDLFFLLDSCRARSQVGFSAVNDIVYIFSNSVRVCKSETKASRRPG